jgi:hypothetical protein
MATLAPAYKFHEVRAVLVRKRDAVLEKYLPRPCMLVSTGLILLGLGIPLLMAVGLLPLMLSLFLLGFILVATGGILALTLCGEL